MATSPLPFYAQPANLLPADLSAAREAFVTRIDMEALTIRRQCGMGGLPGYLVEASCFLAEADVAAPRCDGEDFFGWDLLTSRQFLDGLCPTSKVQEIEAGRAALFEGDDAICPDIARTRREAAQVVDILDARWARNSADYFARRAAGRKAL